MSFYDWVHDNKNKLLNHETLFQPFLSICLEEEDIKFLKTKEEMQVYLTVNAYSDETILSMYRAWFLYEKEGKK